MPIDGSAALSTQGFAWGSETDYAQHAVSPHVCRVLVVDDDSLVRSRLSALLSVARYQVEVAASGAEALRVLADSPCDIVLTDWHMPDMDGLALCRQVRLMPQEKYIYVMMLSIRASDADILTGLTAGADAYVVKGASIDHILARLEIGRRISREPPPAVQNITPVLFDSVTGAYSAPYLVRHLTREFARSQRSGHALAVLACRVEALSLGSVQTGGQVPDVILRDFVTRASACLRDADWTARTGTDEFMIVLPETAARGAEVVAQRLRGVVAVDPLYQSSGPISFAVNIDVTAMPAQPCEDGTHTLQALLRAATRAATIQNAFGTDADSSGTATVSSPFNSANGKKHGLN